MFSVENSINRTNGFHFFPPNHFILFSLFSSKSIILVASVNSPLIYNMYQRYLKYFKTAKTPFYVRNKHFVKVENRETRVQLLLKNCDAKYSDAKNCDAKYSDAKNGDAKIYFYVVLAGR